MSQVAFKRFSRELAGEGGIASSTLLIIIVSLIGILLAWAAVTELDSVVRGQGSVVSASQNQLVQSSDSGVLLTRYVQEGEVVEPGQRLFEVDPIEAKSQLDRTRQQLSVLRAQEIRLQAEVNGEVPEFPNDLAVEAATAIANELALYNARLQQLEGEIATLEQRRLQRQTAIEEAQIGFETAMLQIALIEDEIAVVEPLVQNGLAPETRLIALRRDLQQNQGQANGSVAAQRRLEAALLEVESELETARNSYVTQALTELADVAAQRAETESIMPALIDRVERTTIRSPVNGVVNRINFRTAGAFVQPGDVLLEIVPTGDDLIVEARIDPSDIASLAPGDTVRTSLTAYDPTRYGRIDGRVINISADAATDQNTGQQYYQIDITLEGELYEDDGTAVQLLPGMVATVDVNAGKRSVLDYFWQPMARIKDSAFRE